MATYTKKLKTLVVHLMLDSDDSDVVNIADTTSDDMATRALNEFKRYETMHYETESGGQKVTNAIPYHAVQYIEVAEAEADITKADPYGCDGDEWQAATLFCGMRQYEGIVPTDENGNPIPGRYNGVGDDGIFIREGDPDDSVKGLSIYEADAQGHFVVKFEPNGSCGAATVEPDYNTKRIFADVCC